MEDDLRDRPGDPYASAKLGGLLISEGKADQAIPLLQRGLQQCDGASAERYELLLHLGLALTPSDPAQAVRCYRQALEIPLDTRVSLGARLNLAARLMEQGDLDEAISLTQTAAQRAPEVALAWYNLGLMQRRCGNLAAASRPTAAPSIWIPTTPPATRTTLWPVAGRQHRCRPQRHHPRHQPAAGPEDTDTASQLREQVQGIVKLDGEAVA